MSNNAAVLTRLMLSERHVLLARLRRRFGSEQLAEEVTQSLWFKIRSVSDSLAIVQPRAYLYRLAANLAVDHVRKQRGEATVFSADQPDQQISCDQPSPEQVLIDRDALARLLGALDELPPRCRQVVRMRRLEGMDVGEIAQVLGISRQMIWRYMNQAMDHISARIGDRE